MNNTDSLYIITITTAAPGTTRKVRMYAPDAATAGAWAQLRKGEYVVHVTRVER